MTRHEGRATRTAADERSVVGGDERGRWTVRSLLRWIEGHLAERGVDGPRISAEELVRHVLGCDRLRLYMEPERVLDEAERTTLRGLVLRAANHEPVQYLVGQWPFLGRPFEVGRATLIPRPSTETLVECAVGWYLETMVDRAADGGPLPRPLRMADIGTGTGIIAISIIAGIRARLKVGGCAPLAGAGGKGKQGPDEALPTIQLADDVVSGRPATTAVRDASTSPWRCLATDVVPDAVALAKRNVATHGLTAAIDVRLGSLFEPFRGSRERSFDLIASNPPYISDAEWDDVARNVKDYEPATALRGGRDGLDLVRPLVADAPRWLRSGGLLLVEIAESQRDAALRLASDRSIWSEAKVLDDFESKPRVLVASRA
jgi:release factor glutamine methyltransferase